MLFAVLEGEPRMQTKPAVFYLFVVWSLVELVRSVTGVTAPSISEFC